MGKQTKTIKCPQCGSIQKTEIGNGIYKCEDCNSSYFIDNDDVTINVIERSNTPKKQTKITGGTIVGLIIVFLLILPFIIIKSLHNMGTVVDSGEHFSRNGQVMHALLIEDPLSDKPMAFIIEQDYQIGYYAVLYDLTKQKIVKEKQLWKESRTSSPSYMLKDYFDSWYLEENRDKAYTIYKLDPVNFVFENLADMLAPRFAEFSAGIANLHFDFYIDAFEVLTNDGEKYIYSPYSDKLYEDDNSYDLKKKMEKDEALPFHKGFYYGFTNLERNSKSCPGADKIQLVQLSISSQNKKPKSYEQLKWDHHCTIEALWFAGKYQFVKDLTPDRKYFGGTGSRIDNDAPEVLYWNDKSVFVKLKASANPAATYNLQSIDIETGKLNWSVETAWSENVDIKDFKEYKNCYILSGKFKQSYNFYKIDKNNLDLEQIKINMP
jgi:DNA-directed RNA polymerase subunit M/transcription elongation factor TFIIS